MIRRVMFDTTWRQRSKMRRAKWRRMEQQTHERLDEQQFKFYRISFYSKKIFVYKYLNPQSCIDPNIYIYFIFPLTAILRSTYLKIYSSFYG
jgi:hypothetical protein